MDRPPSSLFIQNRSKLKELLLPYSVVIVSSNRPMPRSGDQYFPFRQSSDFYYLTGINQELCTLVIYPSSKPDQFGETLFLPQTESKKLIWEGERMSHGEAEKISGIRDLRSREDMGPELTKILKDCQYVYFGMEEKGAQSPFPLNEIEVRNEFSLRLQQLQEHMLGPLMTRIRMYKAPEEITMIKTAIGITENAFRSVLPFIRPGAMEYEISARLTYEMMVRGVKDHAFDPIVASGKNALVLHYVENGAICKDGDMLLLDFGADWANYAADISRTVPVNGKFSPRQKELYASVLRVMKKSMEHMKPGITMGELNSYVGSLWEEEHIGLGLYSLADVKKQSSMWPVWKKYFWHGISHSIGIDVHDRFDPDVPLGPGMVLSCEPGIYIQQEGTGIRLEDDVLITDAGAVNLSGSIPIEAEELEELMNEFRNT